MLYPSWAELSSDDQAATVSVQNLGHALTHIRRAIPSGQSSRPPELAEAWKAIDNSVANGGVSDPDGYIANVRAWSVRVGKVEDADSSVARERCEWAIKLAVKFAPANRPPKPPATKPARPMRSHQGGAVAPPPGPQLANMPAHRRSIEVLTDRTPFRPCPELVAILAPAYEPCRHFAGACARVARWRPVEGHVPRGFTGAFGTLDEIELVLVVGEPGDPFHDERYESERSPVEQIEKTAEFSFHALERRDGGFSKAFRRILDFCFPEQCRYEQMRRTWKAESYLCSARREGGHIPRASLSVCGHDYLAPQLELLADRAIVACGNEVRDRIKALGFTESQFLHVPALPRYGNRPGAIEEQRTVPDYVEECNIRRRRQQSPV
jgi:hypothetical protein